MSQETKRFFEWKEEYSVNVKEIDEQHKEYIRILEKLYQAILSVEPKNIIFDIFDEWSKYAKLHFATEEKYFEKFDFKGARAHKIEHGIFSKKIEDIKNKNNQDKLSLSLDFIEAMEDWLVGHIYTLDKEYTECFNSHGLY